MRQGAGGSLSKRPCSGCASTAPKHREQQGHRRSPALRDRQMNCLACREMADTRRSVPCNSARSPYVYPPPDHHRYGPHPGHGPYPSPHHPAPPPNPPCAPRCEPPACHPRPHGVAFRGFHSCKSEAACIPGGTCQPVGPPHASEELVIFRKRYVCSMKDHCKPGEKDCPYVRTVQYIVEPVWEQVDCTGKADDLKDILQDQQTHEIPKNSDLGHCLACAFPEFHLYEQHIDSDCQ
jgi:hypothetical protein